MPELASAARAGGEHRHPPVRRWRCAYPGCGASGVGGAAALTSHYDKAHPREEDEHREAAAVDADGPRRP